MRLRTGTGSSTCGSSLARSGVRDVGNFLPAKRLYKFDIVGIGYHLAILHM